MTCLETFNHTKDQKGRRATFGIRRLDDTAYALAYAITSKGDNFCRSKGRRIVSNRIDKSDINDNRFSFILDTRFTTSLYSDIVSILDSLGIFYSPRVLKNMLERDLWCKYTLAEVNAMKNKPEATTDIPF